MEIQYIREGDYFIPDLELPEESRPIGKWGRMHRDYLREYKPIQYNCLLLSGELWSYLADLNEQVQDKLERMIDQMKMVRRIGSLGAIAKMIPGMPSLTDEQKERAEREMKIFEVVVSSMTPYERRHPECLKNSRKQRIARGSGTTQADVNRVLRKYEQSRDMMKKMKGLKGGRGLPPGFRGF